MNFQIRKLTKRCREREVNEMKIAVSSCGIFLDSPIDPRFGRCDYFVIVDAIDMSFEVFDNDSEGLTQGAGVQSAKFVVSKGAQVVITGHIGLNAIRALFHIRRRGGALPNGIH